MHQFTHFIEHYLSATRKGHNVHSPWAFTLCEEVFYNNSSFYDFEQFKKIRKDLLKDETELSVEDFGAGSKTFKGNKRKVKDIAAMGISTARQSELLYKLVNFLNARTVIELGTSLGLNTLYLSKANRNAKIYTIEGSSALHDFAEKLALENEIYNSKFIRGKFDEELPKLLSEISTIDLLYIDGNHTYGATLKYFHMALAKSINDSVFVFDDIYWSAGMTKAWEEIKNDPKVTLSIDAFYFGLVFFKQEIKEKVHIKIKV